MTATNLILPIMFLAALVLIARGRAALCSHDPVGFVRLSRGLSLLALLSIGNLFMQAGLMNFLISAIDLFWLEFLAWAVAMVGMTMVASGVSGSLPLIKQHRETEEMRALNMNFLTRVKKLVKTEPQLDTILTEVVADMISTFNFRSGAVYKYSQHSGQLLFRAVANPDENIAMDFCAHAGFDQRAFLDHAKGMEKTSREIFPVAAEGAQYPELIIPILVGNNPVGCFAIWTNTAKCDSIDLETINLASSVIADRIERDTLQVKSTAVTTRLQLREILEQDGNRYQRLGEILPSLFANLSQLMSCDMLTVTVRKGTEDKFNRYSVGRTGAVLVEKNLPWNQFSYGAMELPTDSSTELVNDLKASTHPVKTLLAGFAEEGSLIAYRFDFGSGNIACIGITTNQPNAFGKRDTRFFEATRPTLRAAITWELTTSTKENGSEFSRLKELMSGLTAVDEVEVALEATAKFVLQHTNVEAVRISTMDGDDFLKSRTLNCRTEMSGVVPGNGTQILSIMPVHRQALLSGKPVVMSKNSTTIDFSMAEATQMLNESVGTALICPVPISGQFGGTLTVIRSDEKDVSSWKPETVEFLTAVSSLIGMTLTWSSGNISRTGRAAVRQLSTRGEESRTRRDGMNLFEESDLKAL